MIINERKIDKLLDIKVTVQECRKVLERGANGLGLTVEETAVLVSGVYSGTVPREELFEAAGAVRQSIYGNRMVLFAPLYWSSHCINNCAYCGFKVSNKSERTVLSTIEVEKEVRVLIDKGYKRVLLESGEDPERNTIERLCELMEKIYAVRDERGGRIDRINVNIAATTVENYRLLKDADIGTYSLFQETYHLESYKKFHRGPKADYERQITAHDRAIEAGIGDEGLGVLFGLYDWRFETLAIIEHAHYLDRVMGVGPHTISVPRVQSISGEPFNPAYPVDDETFLQIIAILRLAVPYTGIILSTRETPDIRRMAYGIGVSQISAGSSTEVGGYSKSGVRKAEAIGQFDVGDHRPLEDVIFELIELGFIPSFCTACEIKERTGEMFMPYAKSGEIKRYCTPNALVSLKEYLINYASERTREGGKRLIADELEKLPQEEMERVERLIKEISECKAANSLYT
ncbi:MAG: [FeFe] hydrogenase H-cluster radical SAM maturase HydG [Deltaproteobacteria bacterium]|nr:[FeFe] hydrogenase H-cluster radical SAM maturase HydG [Deltaproteobacteria bacterium]